MHQASIAPRDTDSDHIMSTTGSSHRAAAANTSPRTIVTEQAATDRTGFTDLDDLMDLAGRIMVTTACSLASSTANFASCSLGRP